MKPRSAPKQPEPRLSRQRGIARRSVLLVIAAIVFGFGVYGAAGFYGGPWLVDRWLEQYRAAAPGRAASRAMVRFNPFTLVVEIVGIEMRDTQTGTTFVADRVSVDFAAQSLAERRPAVSSMVVDRPRIELASVADLTALARFARDTLLHRTKIGHLQVNGGDLTTGTDAGRDFGLSQLALSLTALDWLAGNAGDFSLHAITTTGTGVSIDGSLEANLERAQGRLQLDELDLETVTSRLGGMFEAAAPSGLVNLAAGFSAESLLSAPLLQITDANLDFSDLSLNPAPGLTVTIDSAAANAAFVAAARDEALDLSGRIEADDTRVTIRDARATPPQSFVFNEAALLATADDDGLSLILGGRLLQAGNAALTVRLPPEPAARSFSFEAYDLPATAVSAYALDALGRRLAAGSVDVNLAYALNGARADGSLHLTVRDLAFARPTADNGADAASLDLAVALLEDADGVIDLDLRFATSTGTVRDALADVLAARIGAVTETPFDILATLTADNERPTGAVAFLPGDAALGDRALASIEALADALNARPRLGIRVYGAYDPSVDRDALAKKQIELHVALATAGADPQARPEPVEFGSPRAQDVLDEFAGERLAAERIAELAERFACEGALAEVCKRVYYEQIFNALVANEAIGPTMLGRLGRFRAQSIGDALRQRGVAEERIELVTGSNTVETPFGIGLAVELTALETAARASAP